MRAIHNQAQIGSTEIFYLQNYSCYKTITWLTYSKTGTSQLQLKFMQWYFMDGKLNHKDNNENHARGPSHAFYGSTRGRVYRDRTGFHIYSTNMSNFPFLCMDLENLTCFSIIYPWIHRDFNGDRFILQIVSFIQWC